MGVHRERRCDLSAARPTRRDPGDLQRRPAEGRGQAGIARGGRMDPLDRDIKRSDPVLGRYFNFIAVDQRLRVRLIAYITWLVVLPLLLFAIFCDIAHKETRFDLGSLDRPVSGGSHDLVVGLSFLGDTMVWPFFLLIPLLLVMLRMAIGATVTLCR